MTTQYAPTTAGTIRIGKRQLMAMAGVAMLALAAAFGAGWRLAGQGEDTGASVTTQPPVQARAESPAVPQGVTPSALDWTVRSEDEDHTREILAVFLVGTAEEAASLQGYIDGANRLRAGTGQPPVGDAVFVVRTPEDEAAVNEWVALVRARQAELRLPGVTVFDLR